LVTFTDPSPVAKSYWGPALKATLPFATVTPSVDPAPWHHDVPLSTTLVLPFAHATPMLPFVTSLKMQSAFGVAGREALHWLPV
jgi:hypothetical protein